MRKHELNHIYEVRVSYLYPDLDHAMGTDRFSESEVWTVCFSFLVSVFFCFAQKVATATCHIDDYLQPR